MKTVNIQESNNKLTTTKKRSCIFKPHYWFSQECNNRIIIHVSGRTQDNQSVYAKVIGFKPYSLLELPSYGGWNRDKCQILFNHLKKSISQGEDLLVDFEPCMGYNIYGLSQMYCMKIWCRAETATKKISYFLNKAGGFYLPGVGNINSGEIKIHELNIDTVLKFATNRNLKLADWIKITEYISYEERVLSIEERKFATTDIDMFVNCKDISHVEIKDIHIYQKYFSFDIECYSKNHNSKLPNAHIPENVIFNIAIVIGELGKPENRYKILLSLGQPRKERIQGCDELIILKSESKLLLEFTNLVQKYDPDIFIGYNIMKFDWDYMIIRAAICNITSEFLMLSRLTGVPADIRSINWSSKAYGEQKFSYPECFGRTNVDVLLEVERNHKLSNYRLNTVAEYFLNDCKDDISPRGLFMLYQLTKTILPKLEIFHMNEYGIPIQEQVKLRSEISNIFDIKKCHGVVKKYRKELLISPIENLYDLCKRGMEFTGQYCIQDTLLPVDLAENLNIWPGMESMSNVCGVPISYLNTRGQQIKVVSQIYKDTSQHNVVLPNLKRSDVVEKYQGAIVIEAHKGFYKRVATLDFASLYPSIIIAFNICYTTFIKDSNTTISDEECNIIPLVEHVGCDHDPFKRKKKKEDILCKDVTYKYKKVIYVINKETKTITRLNEGVMPRLNRTLLAARKEKKFEMLQVESQLKQHKGTATEEDILLYKKCKFNIIEVGSLTKEEVDHLELKWTKCNADQLALKVSANSSYGYMGVNKGMLPFIPGAATVTNMGRKLITMAIEKVRSTFPFGRLVYGDTDSCMIYFEGKELTECFDLAAQASSLVTHYLRCYIIGIPEDYCVLVHTKDEDGNIISTKIPINKIESKHPSFWDLTYEEQSNILKYTECPVKLEFENMYGTFFLLTKKRYLTDIVNKDGKITASSEKGVVSKRRDNCKYLRDSYNSTAGFIKLDLPENEVMNVIYDRVNLLFTGLFYDKKNVESKYLLLDTDLVIYTGVKTIMNYAQHIVEKSGKTEVTVFTDVNNDVIIDPVGPMDPRLVYPNLPQVLLALKMMRRGEDVPPNTRLEYLYLQKDDSTHQGQKAEDYTFYKENKKTEGFKPDFLHYLEKQLCKPVTELITVKFPKPIRPYIDEDTKFIKLMNKFNDLHRVTVSNIKVYNKDRPKKRFIVDSYNQYGNIEECANVVYVGWDVFEYIDDNKYKQKEYYIKNKISKKKEDTFKQYIFKNRHAKISYILDQMKYGESGINGCKSFSLDNIVENDKTIDNYMNINKKTINRNAMKKSDNPEMYEWGLWLKSNDYVDRAHKQYGQTKRSLNIPTFKNESLRPQTEIVMIDNSLQKEGVTEGMIGVIVERIEIGKGKDIKYFYDIRFRIKHTKNDVLVKNVARNTFTTFTTKDGTILEDILKYRQNYDKVIRYIRWWGDNIMENHKAEIVF